MKDKGSRGTLSRMGSVPRLLPWTLACLLLWGCSSDDGDGSSTASGGADPGGSGSGGTATGGATGGAATGGTRGGNSSGGNSSGGSSGGGNPTGGGSPEGGAPGGDAGSGGEAGTEVPAGLLDPDRTTRWNPGILADDQLELGPDGIPVRTTVCATPVPGDDLNQAIADCPEGQVVELAAGTYPVSSVVTLSKGVVLRGMGSQGADDGGTTIERSGGGSVLRIGSSQDQACYESAYDDGQPLPEDAVKETSVVQVGDAAGDFSPGDLALLDEEDDDEVDQGDCEYFKRVVGRSVSERVEIADVDTQNGTLTLSSPLHWTFRADHSAEISRLDQPIVRYAGIESLAIRGGENPGYNGQEAGGIDVSNTVNCWIRDVQTDQSIGGMHVVLSGSFRTVVRDSHFHHSASYGFGEDCYGIVLRCGSADNLIENNIVRYMNKPILFNVSGGGNVVAYNYADNSWATPAEWQEVNIDTHCSFPHMELMEGNYAPHMGATITHGNAGYLTYFRNYSSSQFAPPAVAEADSTQTGNITALQFDTGDVKMTVIGNVFGSDAGTDLGTAPVSAEFLGRGSDTPAILRVGDNGMDDIAYTSLVWHANYDTVNDDVVYDPSIDVQVLPDSLYLDGRPGFWPGGVPFPWAGPDLDPQVGELPAKARSDAL